MHRIDDPSAVASLPAPRQPGTPGYFTQGSPTTGQEATIVSDDWANATQEELCYVIEQSGLVLSKTDRTQLFQALARLTRRKLTAAATFYVSTTGNDATGDGLTQSTAWATLQHAYEYVRDHIDCNGFQVSIQMMHGTYSQAVFSFPVVGPSPIITGDPNDPTACIVNNPNGPAIATTGSANVVCEAFTVQAAGPEGDYGAVGSGLLAVQASTIVFDNMNFGACSTAHMQSAAGSTITLGSVGKSYRISGGGEMHLYMAAGFISTADCHISIGGTPNFSTAFAYATQGGLLHGWRNTYTGAATGKRYAADTSGMIFTQNAGANYFPGSVAGSVDTATYGLYL